MTESGEYVSGKGKFQSGIWIFITLAFILFAYNESMILDPALLPKFIAVSVLMLAFGIFLIFKFLPSFAGYPLPNNGILIGLLLYVIAGVISLIYSSNTADGIFDWLKMILLLSSVYFFSFYFREDENFIKNLTIGISIFALISSAIGIYQITEISIGGILNHQSTYIVKSTFANRNLFAEVLLLTLPFSLFGSIDLKGNFRFLSTISAASSGILIVALLVREVWVAAFVSVVATAVVFFVINYGNIRNIIKTIPRKIIWISGGSITLFFIVVVLLYGRTGAMEQFKKQTSFISNPYYGSSKDRFDLWERSFKIIKKHPILGTGIGTWKIQQLQFSEQGTVAEDAVTFYQSPHNDFIWIWTEMGITGLLCYLIIFFSSFYYNLRLIKKLKGKPASVFYYFIFFSLCSYVVISNFGFPRERIEQQVLLVFLFTAIIIGHYKHSPENNTQKQGSVTVIPKMAAIMLLSIILAFGSIYGMVRFVSEMHIRKAFEARAEDDQKMVIKQMDAAESFARHIDPLSTPLSWYQGSSYYVTGDMDNALKYFSIAYHYNPYHVHVLNNYGSSLELHGRHTDAIQMYKKVLKINPVFDNALINLCAVYFNTEQPDSAYFTLRKVNTECTDPRYLPTIEAVIPPILTKIYEHTSEKYIKDGIERIRNDRNWCSDIFRRAVKNKVCLHYQCILDIFYLMKQNHTLPGDDEVENIKAKYKNERL